MEKLKSYLLGNFEQVFVLLALVTTALTNYFIPLKLAFLNFYFLPIILAGYYLGQREAVLGAFLCVLMVGIYVVLFPAAFWVQNSTLEILAYVPVWGGFLILAGAVVGRLQEKLADEIKGTRRLNEDLQARQEELREANIVLKDHSENLESRVRERTEELEHSKRAVEALKAKVEDTLYSTMDSSVVNLIIEGRLRNEKRDLAILFSDLVNFTTYSEEHPPEIVIRDLNRYLGEMEPTLLAYRAHIDRYMGDGIMCEFGAPLDCDTYRLLAVLAGLKLQEKLTKGSFPWLMRVGIASGSTITGLIGSKRQTYTAIGDVANIAARLQSLCTPARVLIDRPTYDGISRWVDATKKRDLAREIHDVDKERQLEKLHERVAANGTDSADVFYQIGQIHMTLGESVDAFHYFERALQVDATHVQAKVAYAEAGMQIDATGRISVKGRRQRVEAFEVVGIKNPLENRDKLPPRFLEEYRELPSRIQIPADLIQPVEALDGSLGHAMTVAVLGYAVAAILGLPETERLHILHAGFVADIGMEIVPHHLLNRRGALSASEHELVKQHPAEGVRILKGMGYENEAMLKIVRHSHELLDGSGYPEGLRGDAIPIGARIHAVVDAYDALTSWRPYRDSWARDAAIDEVRRGTERGIYSPEIVDALIRLVG